jgi:YfiH family protein
VTAPRACSEGPNLTEGWVQPEWPAPGKVRAYTTTRGCGYSRGPWQSFNLAAHVGDQPEAVEANRRLLTSAARLPDSPRWLKQVHGTRVIRAEDIVTEVIEADACMAETPAQVCAVLTADCVPVLLCNHAGTRVAAAHTGWRGLAAGVLESTVGAMARDGELLLAWLGPAISAPHFEVKEDVCRVFTEQDPEATHAFTTAANGRWQADLYQLARLRLQRLGVTQTFGGNYCTYRDAERFFSYRRERVTGRMATLIWIASPQAP